MLNENATFMTAKALNQQVARLNAKGFQVIDTEWDIQDVRGGISFYHHQAGLFVGSAQKQGEADARPSRRTHHSNRKRPQKRTSRQQVIVGAFQPPLFEMIVKPSTPMK